VLETFFEDFMSALLRVLGSATTRRIDSLPNLLRKAHSLALQRYIPALKPRTYIRKPPFYAQYPFISLRHLHLERYFGGVSPVRSVQSSGAQTALHTTAALAVMRARKLATSTKPPSQEEHLKRLERLHASLKTASAQMVGYPVTQVFDYSKLYPFLELHANNVGDPFQNTGYFGLNTLTIEREVIEQFADILHAPHDDFWGHVTNGGTEGNLYGLYVARELYPDGVVFFSDQTHYSVLKNVHVLRMPHIQVASQSTGEIDYVALKAHLAKLQKPPIIVVNAGTTMTGATDNVAKIKEILAELKITKYYIHSDAALFGMILPFLPPNETLPFDFRTGVDSIAISGHKMIGSPVPCGVVITKKSCMEGLGRQIAYIGTRDITLSGSRSAISPLILWYALKCAPEDRKKLARESIEKADYAIKKFSNYGIKAWRNKSSPIVVFPRPSEQTIRKWQIAADPKIAHIITMPHVTHKMIDQIAADVAKDLKK
jgi:histidine decarboxylase